jgi:hypothetical protein
VSSEVFVITDLPDRGDDVKPDLCGTDLDAYSVLDVDQLAPVEDEYTLEAMSGGFVAGLLFAAIAAVAVVLVLFAPPLPVRIVGLALVATFGPLSFSRITRRGGTR